VARLVGHLAGRKLESSTLLKAKQGSNWHALSLTLLLGPILQALGHYEVSIFFYTDFIEAKFD
jgi:hypothetical protein